MPDPLPLRHLTHPFPTRLVPEQLIPLLQTPAARDWSLRISEVLDDGSYTFQLPFDGPPLPRTQAKGAPILLFSTYSYAGLAADPRLAAASAAAIARYGTSTGGVRLLSGTIGLHEELEQAIARFVAQPDAVTYSSGYAANLAVISSLFGSEDTCFIDQIAHASLHSAVHLSGMQRRVFRHNDMKHLRKSLARPRAGRTLIVVDGVFSMHGDQAPLAELVAIKEEAGAFLLVDEAHSLAAIGKMGRGLWEAQGIEASRVDIVTGSLSKGVPASGGFVAGARELALFLRHGSPPFIFSAALSPSSSAVALETFRILESEPDHMARLRHNQRLLRQGLKERGFPVSETESPIVPLVLGDARRAYRFSRELLKRGIHASAVTWPAVAQQHCRLRLCATAGHTESDFAELFAAIDEIQKSEP